MGAGAIGMGLITGHTGNPAVFLLTELRYPRPPGLLAASREAGRVQPAGVHLLAPLASRHT
jgi:hypothetical protein